MTNLFEGQRVRLTPLNSEDAAVIAEWHLDSRYLRLLDAAIAFPKNEAQVVRWIQSGQQEKDNFLFGIRTMSSNLLIGFIEINGILWPHGTGWIAIGIGEPEYRGQGYGYEAMSMALNYAFHELNLHRMQLTVFSYNTSAIALYEKLGFQREGVHREFLLRDGQRHDMILYGLLSREWEGE
ncbi:MAG: GNAT family N-acetyltransferase [Anaerolineaceae bacterium]|nr:GNAT family N-acetyltransferase [Anaerolineaceae bacterium]